MSRGARSSRTKPPRERRCVVSGAVKPEAELLRVALGPDGVLVPDVAAKLPGRGGWVSADRASVELERGQTTMVQVSPSFLTYGTGA